MTEPKPKSRRRLRRIALILLGLVLAWAIVGSWFMTTPTFQRWLRGRVMSQIAGATGGTVELGALHTTPLRFRLDARALTIHGKETPGSPPLLHADRIVADFNPIALLSWRFGVENLSIDSPKIHVEFYPDGTTNVPAPQTSKKGKNGVTQLFDLNIRKVEVHNGELQWQQETVPLELAARDVNLQMAHALFRGRYEGQLHVGKVDTHLHDWRPFSWAADLDFHLTRDRLQVLSLNVSSGKSRFRFSGEVVNFVKPRVQGKYEGQIQLSDTGSILREPTVSGGIGEFSGEGSWSGEAFSTQGKLAFRDVVLQAKGESLRNASLSTQFKVTDRDLELHNLQAHAFSGSISGEIQVADWQNSEPVIAKRKANVQKGTLKLKLKDLSVAELAPWISSADFPLNRLRPSGAVAGSIESKWSEAFSRADTIVGLDITPLARQNAGGLPLTGEIRAVYHGAPGELELGQLLLATRNTGLEASGTLGAKAGNLVVSAHSSDLAEWQPLVSSFHGAASLPVRLFGAGSFGGYLSGNLRQPQVTGRVELTEFETSFLNPQGIETRRIHWNYFSTDLQASRDGVIAHHGILRHGGMNAQFDAQVGLTRGELRDSSPVAVNLAVQDGDIADAIAMAGHSFPVAGSMSLNLRITGTKANPVGGGELHLKNAKIYGEEVRAIDSQVRLAGSKVEFRDAALSYGTAQAHGNFAYDFDTRQFRTIIDASNVDLERLPRIRDSRWDIAGKGQFHLQGSGTLEEPVLNAHAEIEGIEVGDESEGSVVLDASTQGSTLHLVVRSDLGERHLKIDGEINMRGDWPGKVTLSLMRFDVDPLLQQYLRGRLTGHSILDGSLEVNGPFRSPRQLDATGEISEWGVEVENVKLRNDGPIRFRMDRQVLRLEPFHLQGDGTSFTGRGTIEIGGERRLDLVVDGQINLVLLQTISRDVLSSGTLKASARIIGTADQPSIEGKVYVENANLTYSDPPVGVSDLNGTLVFNQGRLQIEELTGRSGGSTVTLGGYLQYGRYLEFNITAKGTDVRLRYPQGMSSTASVDLRLSGSSASATLSGEILVSRFALNPGFDFSTYLARSRLSAFSPESDSFLNRVKFDIPIRTSPELSVSSNLGKVSGDADLRLRGTPVKPVLLGRVSNIEGDIYFNGGKYKIEHGEVSFTNPVKIEPVLDLSATTRVRDYDITIRFTGKADTLKVNYSSEPTLPQADIIALLALGRTQEESARLGGSQSAFTQEASNAILGQAINATVSSRVQKLFGVSRIKIDPQAPGTETSSIDRGPQVTIEQQVSNRLTITYIQPVSQATQQTIQGELNVTKNISLVAVRDQNGVFAFDIRIRQRKK